MAEDEVRPLPEPPRSGQPMPNRGATRPPAIIEGTAEPLPFEAPTPVDAAPEAPAERVFDPAVHEPSMAAAGADLATGVEPSAGGEPVTSDEPASGAEPAARLAQDETAHQAKSHEPPQGAAFTAPSRVEPPARRSGLSVLLAVIGVALVLLLGAILYTLAYPPNVDATAALRTDTDALKQRLAALEARPDPTGELKPLQDRIAAIGSAMSGLKGDLADTRSRLEALAGAKPAEPAPAAPAVDLAPLQAKIADLEQSVTALQAAPKVDTGPMEARVADLGQKLDALQASVAALPRVDLAPLDKSVADLDARLKPVEAALSASKTTAQVTEARREGSAAETRAAPLAVTAQATLQAIGEGRPFEPEVAALTALGVAEPRLAPLRAVADKGTATTADLSGAFDSVKGAVRRAGAPPVTGTVLDRMLAGAQGLVKVRPAGSEAGQDTDAVVSRIEAALRAGALPEALTEWGALPADGKAASQAWADRLKARVDAEAAARAIGAEAIAAIAPPQ